MRGADELVLVTIVFAVVIGQGLWMATTSTNPWSGKTGFSNRPWGASKMTPDQINKHGRIQAIVGSVGYAAMLAAIFGVFGPIKNIYIIKF